MQEENRDPTKREAHETKIWKEFHLYHYKYLPMNIRLNEKKLKESIYKLLAEIIEVHYSFNLKDIWTFVHFAIVPLLITITQTAWKENTAVVLPSKLIIRSHWSLVCVTEQPHQNMVKW